MEEVDRHQLNVAAHSPAHIAHNSAVEVDLHSRSRAAEAESVGIHYRIVGEEARHNRRYTVVVDYSISVSFTRLYLVLDMCAN